MEKITAQLFAMADEEYKKFSAKLIPNIDSETIIGIKTPPLRAFAKTLPESESNEFLSELPHKYFDENQLHSFIICNMRDYERCLCEVDRFLPFVDNWATCDQLSPKVFAKNKDKLLPEVYRWIASEHTYTIRFGVGMLLCHYLDDSFTPEHLRIVAAIRSEEYYIRMMCAWYFATAIAKQSEDTLPYFEQGILEEWVRKKAIQKANESRRVSDDIKNLLKNMK